MINSSSDIHSLLWELSAVIACASYDLLFRQSGLRCGFLLKSCKIHNVQFRMRFYCLPFYKTGHAMTELWHEIVKIEKKVWWSQKVLYFKMPSKWWLLWKNQAEDVSREEQKWIFPFLNQEEECPLFYSIVEVRPCLCDTRQHCVPDFSASSLVRLNSAFPCRDTCLSYRNSVILISWQKHLQDKMQCVTDAFIMCLVLWQACPALPCLVQTYLGLMNICEKMSYDYQE